MSKIFCGCGVVGYVLIPIKLYSVRKRSVVITCDKDSIFNNNLQTYSWLVVLGFNATLMAKVISWQSGDAHVFPGFLTPVLRARLFFPKPPTTFSHASAEVKGENKLGRKFVSTGDRAHSHQGMSLTHPPLSHPGGAQTYKLFSPTH